MALERNIEKGIDGSTFSDKVMLYFEEPDGKKIAFFCDPDGLYSILHVAILKMAQGGMTDENPERKRLAALMKVAIKGMLIMYGNKILDEIFASKEHPKPGKGDDLLDWYTDIFTKVGIAHLMKNDTILTGKVVHEGDNETLITVDTVSTRPVS